MPTYVLAKLLSWLPSSLSTDEYQHLQNSLVRIVPEEKLLQQAIFNWIKRKDSHDTMLNNTPMEESNCESETCSHPIDDLLLWHKAIKRELNETLEKIKMMYISGDFASRSAFDERLKFIAEICIFHSIAKDKVIFPEIYGETSIFHQHGEVKSKFNEFWHLIGSGGAFSSTSAEFLSNICSCADQIVETINNHFFIEEVQVLPLARMNLNVKRQQEILYQSLCMMPLRLIEQVLPWLIGAMTDEEAHIFLNNIQLAAPASDAGLIKLFSSWSCKVGNQSLCSFSRATGSYPTERPFDVNGEFFQPFSPFHIALPAGVVSSVSSKVGDSSSPSKILADGCEEQPIDILFKVHKAIRRDLEYLSIESARVSDSHDETFLHQFIGRFSLFWGLYRAHANSKDNIVYPALESREGLYNVAHSYKLEHKLEERKFEHISSLLSELSQIHISLKSVHGEKESSLSTFGVTTNYDIECIRQYYELSAKLEHMCKSIRMMIDQHMSREELEMWPLFRIQFSMEEQHKIIGFILGSTGGEMLQLMLPWVLSALSKDEHNKMMATLKHVTRNTMFSEWLDECWQGTSIRMFPNVSPKGEFQRSMGFSMLNPHKNDTRKVYLDPNSEHGTKKYLQNGMISYWMGAQQRLPQSLSYKDFTSENLKGRFPSFRDPENKVFGCEHYKRNCKIRASCCDKLVTCNFCHGSMSDHAMGRKETSEMMCMRCLVIQPIGPICKTPSCNGFSMAEYYCSICKLFDDERKIYHCPFCNLCRVGRELGVDYFHCMSCNCCLSIRLVNHECKEKCLETSCPICDKLLFTSTTPVRGLPCGHYIHSACFEACNSSPFSCLICSQSSANTTMALAESKVKVGGDGSSDWNMKPFGHGEKGHMETSSWTEANLQKDCGVARLWTNRLYPLLLWFVTPFFNKGKVQRIGKDLQIAVEGNKAKDRFFLCFVLVCSLVVFCVMSSLVVLLCLQIVGQDKYVFAW
ncbi:zinc finger protein BRUTUS-like isoform X2 [Humulus lupulus]|uniref:zinc finger protein BRUTUS-like isoform X2 n=1 Tax=Humulus lupulus TaxID=3486 RepID=UPI002B415412|nr:zinc finger protein BRUTUS-like isoform X2 [Humulus lupulus]